MASSMAPIGLSGLPHVLVLGLLLPLLLLAGTPGCRAQFAPCPANATSCCQCITTPGCSWYHGPPDADPERMPRCRPLALVVERPESNSQRHLSPPGVVSVLDVTARGNRPLNPQRNRLLRPQSARVTVGLGVRHLVPLQVMALSRRIRLKVVGPSDAPEFTLQRGDGLSCMNRFLLRERGERRGGGGGGGGRRRGRAGGESSNGGGEEGASSSSSSSTLSSSSPNRSGRRPRQAEGARRRSRNRGREREEGGRNSSSSSSSSRRNSRRKQLLVDCYVSAPGEVQSLNLVIDMNRCYSGKKTIKVQLRERGIKRTKVDVYSACSCPCQRNEGRDGDGDGQGEDGVVMAASGQEVEGQLPVCPAGKRKLECDSVEEQGAGNSECSGVNSYCQRSEDEAACSGHGICMCAVCMCNIIPTPRPNLFRDEAADDDAAAADQNQRTAAVPQPDNSNAANTAAGTDDEGLQRASVAARPNTNVLEGGEEGEATAERTTTSATAVNAAGVGDEAALGVVRQRYTGAYCQCDDTSCPWSGGAMCGGPSRGVCRCGECWCSEGYRGDDCGVSTSAQACRDQSGRLCNDQGLCVDGECQCRPGYTGALCEVCARCAVRCGDFRSCVSCLLLPAPGHHRGPRPEDCDARCDVRGANLTGVMLTESGGEWPASGQICTLRAGRCDYEYAYLAHGVEPEGDAGGEGGEEAGRPPQVELFYSTTPTNCEQRPRDL